MLTTAPEVNFSPLGAPGEDAASSETSMQLKRFKYKPELYGVEARSEQSVEAVFEPWYKEMLDMGNIRVCTHGSTHITHCVIGKLACLDVILQKTSVVPKSLPCLQLVYFVIQIPSNARNRWVMVDCQHAPCDMQGSEEMHEFCRLQLTLLHHAACGCDRIGYSIGPHISPGAAACHCLYSVLARCCLEFGVLGTQQQAPYEEPAIVVLTMVLVHDVNSSAAVCRFQQYCLSIMWLSGNQMMSCTCLQVLQANALPVPNMSDSVDDALTTWLS